MGIRLYTRKNALMVEVPRFSETSLREVFQVFVEISQESQKKKKKHMIWYVQVSNSEGDLRAGLHPCFIFQARLFLWWSFFPVVKWLEFWTMTMIINSSFQTKFLNWNLFTSFTEWPHFWKSIPSEVLNHDIPHSATIEQFKRTVLQNKILDTISKSQHKHFCCYFSVFSAPASLAMSTGMNQMKWSGNRG